MAKSYPIASETTASGLRRLDSVSGNKVNTYFLFCQEISEAANPIASPKKLMLSVH
jgi:hypothetical protein